MPKIEPFHRNCSSRNCTDVRAEVFKSYDRKSQKKKPARRMKGGLEVRVLEPARIPIAGEKGEYVVSGHGVGVQFRRCYEFDFIDKYTHRQTTQTCTEKRVVNVPRRVLNCYESVSETLEETRKGKRGRPGINLKVLALVACSKSGLPPTRVAEPMTPAVASAVTGLPYYAVRRSMDELKKTGKIKCTHKQRLAVIEEEQCFISKTYQKAFDDFVRSEKEARKWAGFRRIFGKEFAPTPTLARKLPEAEVSRYSGIPRGFKPKKLSKKALRKFRREAEEWRARTGLRSY